MPYENDDNKRKTNAEQRELLGDKRQRMMSPESEDEISSINKISKIHLNDTYSPPPSSNNLTQSGNIVFSLPSFTPPPASPFSPPSTPPFSPLPTGCGNTSGPHSMFNFTPRAGPVTQSFPPPSGSIQFNPFNPAPPTTQPMRPMSMAAAQGQQAQGQAQEGIRRPVSIRRMHDAPREPERQSPIVVAQSFPPPNVDASTMPKTAFSFPLARPRTAPETLVFACIKTIARNIHTISPDSLKIPKVSPQQLMFILVEVITTQPNYTSYFPKFPIQTINDVLQQHKQSLSLGAIDDLRQYLQYNQSSDVFLPSRMSNTADMLVSPKPILGQPTIYQQQFQAYQAQRVYQPVHIKRSIQQPLPLSLQQPLQVYMQQAPGPLLMHQQLPMQSPMQPMQSPMSSPIPSPLPTPMSPLPPSPMQMTMHQQPNLSLHHNPMQSTIHPQQTPLHQSTSPATQAPPVKPHEPLVPRKCTYCPALGQEKARVHHHCAMICYSLADLRQHCRGLITKAKWKSLIEKAMLCNDGKCQYVGRNHYHCPFWSTKTTDVKTHMESNETTVETIHNYQPDATGTLKLQRDEKQSK